MKSATDNFVSYKASGCERKIATQILADHFVGRLITQLLVANFFV